MMVNNPPPKRKIAYPSMVMEMARDDGFVVEIFSNNRLSEKGIDEVFFLNFFAIFCFLVVD